MKQDIEIITMERVNQDFGPTEDDFSHPWLTSMQPHFEGLVKVNDNNIRNLRTVLFNREADQQMRIRALAQLHWNANNNDCAESSAVLAQLVHPRHLAGITP
jgi:hypothetical protein